MSLSESITTEGPAMRRLVKVAQSISAIRGNDARSLNPNVMFECNPHTSLENVSCGSFVMQDAPKPEHSCSDLSLPFACTHDCSDTAYNQVVPALLQRMHDRMCKDPRRRFIIGMTVEDAKLRIWFCNRSELLVSEAVSIMEDDEVVVRFLLTVMHANEEELGLDPTMRVVLDPSGSIWRDDDGAPRYDITMRMGEDPVVYRTTGPHYDSGRGGLIGRGARIWQVRKLEGGKECGAALVLRDEWAAANCPREGAVLARLMGRRAGGGSVRYACPDAVRLICHGDVLVDRGVDATLDLEALDSASAIKPAFRYRAVGNAGGNSGGRGSVSEVLLEEPRANKRSWLEQHHRRVHYRIVCDVSYKVLANETSLHNVVSALIDALVGLGYLHESGAVHKDVNPRNVIIHCETEGNVRASLVDLDDARRSVPCGPVFVVRVPREDGRGVDEMRFPLGDAARVAELVYAKKARVSVELPGR
ncbi:hypothetical protein IEO21_09496 [Rhodonia placenta]|uniref:Fungal-type protein kinase domain-containing protein n=1 Tax=Rhodonia placenta TaxID=104341 RepID=A0A8H7NUA7_9APHY|nr:hypothetical protein IEO21_09496 [Postia placenta]